MKKYMPFKKGHKLNIGNTYCVGKIPWNKGTKGISHGPLGQHWQNSEDFKKRVSKFMKGNKYNVGRKHTPEHTQKIINANSGEKNYRWIKDRTLLKDDHKDRIGQLHREWSKNVKKRDNWKCKINNLECNGRLKAHHILSWKNYLELRYDINNGITLCHFHHPMKRNEEVELSPYFKQLINQNG